MCIRDRDGADALLADIPGRAFLPEKSIIRDNPRRHGKVLVLQIHHIDGIAEKMGGRINQILKPVS